MSWWKRAPWQPKSLIGLDRVELAPDPPIEATPAGTLAPPGRGWTARVTGGNQTPVWTYPADDADHALSIWQQRRELHESTGWWPILADWDFWDSVDRPGLTAADPAATGVEWLSRRLYDGSRPLADQMSRGVVNWRSAGGRSRTAIRNVLGAREVVLVPAPSGWLAPEILGWTGATKVGVYGPQHTLVLRRWAGLWGAEPQGMGSDELILRVTRPPRPRDEAWLAAVELAAYCPELVSDRGSTLEDLAGAMTWGFWDIVFDLDDTEDDGPDDDEPAGDEFGADPHA